MKIITDEEQKRLQLNILKSIHLFCIEHGLHYTLAYGTLIGAVRHNGYIPWDDDIDIAMPRQDYELFIHGYKNERYKLHCLENDPDYLNAYAKVEDSRTMIDEEGSTKKLGVFVDVFPLDPLFDDPKDCKKLFGKVTFFRRLLVFRVLTKQYFLCWWKRWIFIGGKIFLSFLSKRWLAETIDGLAKSGNANALYWGMFAGSLKFAIITKTDLEEYVLHKFEDNDFYILSNYDHWLRQIYGEYMTPPPVDKQKTVHFFNKVYWKE